MNTLQILLSVSAEQIFNYSIKDIVIFLMAGVALVKAYESIKKWIKEKRENTYEEIDGDLSLKTTVTNDHDRLGAMEKQVLAITRCVKEMLKTDLMESHDRYMSRKPFPYITRYERLIHISMYDAYASLDDPDPVLDGFHKELLELTIRDEDRSSGDLGGDI